MKNLLFRSSQVFLTIALLMALTSTVSFAVDGALQNACLDSTTHSSACQACCLQYPRQVDIPLVDPPLYVISREQCISECRDLYTDECVDWALYQTGNRREWCMSCCLASITIGDPPTVYTNCQHNCDVVFPLPTPVPSVTPSGTPPPAATPSPTAAPCALVAQVSKEPDGSCPSSAALLETGTNCPTNTGSPQSFTTACYRCPTNGNSCGEGICHPIVEVTNTFATVGGRRVACKIKIARCQC